MTEVQELVARLRLKDEMSGPIRKVRAGISGVSDALNSPRMQKGISQIGTGLKSAALIGAVGIAALTSQVALGLRSLIELEQQEAQTAAVIKSTGGVAGITAEQVGKLAEKYEALNAIIGDEVIREAENMLLTFTNVREDAFEPALEAILNMNTALGKGPEGLQSTAIAVGKALNDPVGGLVALKKAGVNLDDGQKALIKSLVETGDVLGAQKIIIAELDKEFGGSFLAQGNTTAGKVASFTDAIEDLQRVLATALLPVVGKVATELQKLLASDEFIQGAKDIGAAIAGLFTDENIAAGGAVLRDVFNAAKTAAPVVLAAAKATASIVGAAVGLFRSLPPEIQQLAIGAFAVNKLTGGLVTNIAGGLISGVLKQLVSGVVNVRGASVIVTGAAGAGGVAGAAGKGTAGKIASAVGKVFLVGAAAGVFAELTGVLSQQTAANQGLISGLKEQTAKFSGGASLATLRDSLAGVDGEIRRLMTEQSAEGFAFRNNIDGVKDAVFQARTDIAAAVDRATIAQTVEGRAAIAATERVKAATAAMAAGVKAVITGGTARQVAASLTGARAAEAAGNAVSATVRAKDLSLTTVNQNTVNVSYRDTVRVSQTHKSIYHAGRAV